MQLLADLPEGVDPCGENGEFHTCVVAGPMFARGLPVTTGERVERDGYAYCDLVMAGKRRLNCPVAATSGSSFRGARETSEPGIRRLIARDSGFALTRAPE